MPSGIRNFTKNQTAFLIHGLVFLFFLCIIFYFCFGIWNFIQFIGWKFFSNRFGNFLANALLFLLAAYGIGKMLSIPGVRSLISAPLGTLPFVGTVMKFMDLMTKMKERAVPEVDFEPHPGSRRWQLAWVSNEFEDGDVVYCSVHVPIQAYPGGFYYSRVPKSELHFTGRQAWQTFLTCLSGGLL